MSQNFTQELMQEWSERSVRVISIQGLAKVRLETPEKSLNGTQVILAEKPSRLRAETLSPFGSPLVLLAADGERLEVFLPSKNIYYSGAASATNLSRFVRIPLRLTDLVSFLLYQPPLIDVSSETAFELPEVGWLVVRDGTSRRQELVFNGDRQLVEISYYDRNTLLVKITYGKFAEENSFPLLFNIELPEQASTASLEFSEPETNTPLSSEIFKLSPPEGVTTVFLDEK